MELRNLKYFCLLAEMEHVSKAADRLCISQPFLTKVIGQLEDELGVQLFDNVGRRIKLNKYGEAFYARVNKILSDLDGAVEELETMLDTKEHTINFICDNAGYSADIMLAYNRAFPHNKMIVTYGIRKGIIEALTIGDADFALSTPPITDNKNIKTSVVYTVGSCVMLPPEHPLSGHEAVSLEELKDEPMVTSPKGAGVRNNIDAFFSEKSWFPNIVCEALDMELLIKAVLGGIGFTILPDYFLNDPLYGKYCVKISDEGSSAQIGISYNANRAELDSTTEFVAFIEAFFRAL